MEIEQLVTVQTGEQFARVEYQGPMRGFQSFFTPTNALLNTPDAQAMVFMRLVFKFEAPVLPEGVEIRAIAQALKRNPVERLNLTVREHISAVGLLPSAGLLCCHPSYAGILTSRCAY
jgi:hypothetical protein